jgi:N,N-dimethylformamidase
MVAEAPKLPRGIDGSRTDLFEEFMERPFGRHSADLQALLNYMRGCPIVGKHFLVMTRSNVEWMLARFTEGDPLGVERLPEVTFDDIEEAERYVFSLRWATMFGGDLPDGSDVPDPDSGTVRLGFEGPEMLAYADRQTLRAGEEINFKASCSGVETYRLDIVRLLSPDLGDGPDVPAYVATEMMTPVCGDHPARHQDIHPGSFVHVPAGVGEGAERGFTIVVSVFPTLLSAGEQMLFGTYCNDTATGVGLFVGSDGCLGLVCGDGTVPEVVLSDVAVAESRWSCVAVSCDGSGGVTFHAGGLASHHLEARGWEHEEHHGGPVAGLGDGPLVIGAEQTTGGWAVSCFNGRLERPRLYGHVLDDAEIESMASQGPGAPADGALGDWDFSVEIGSEAVRDVSGNERHGLIVNMPTRGVGGSNWSGRTSDWRTAPEEYGAIHFHDDDISDACWETTQSLRVPSGWAGGCYAGRFRAGGAEFWVPFAVRPAVGASTSDVAFLLPTATYGAYANLQMRVLSPWNEMIHGRLTVLDDTDLLMLRFSEIGGCTYDNHSDGSTVVHSSMHRPVTNFRPHGRMYKFCQDLLIVAWLERTGMDYDVISDDDVHNEGSDALAPYRVLVTSSHPEYTSTEMMDAIEAFARGGGRLINLGGNTYWHRIAYHPTRSGMTEVRRPDLPRLWRADASQGHDTFTGEPAGTWIGIGRGPHTIGGVGFITQGFDACSYYRRTAAGHDPRAAFIFEGVDDEIIGDFGILQGGAAGYEIERVDAALGTPAHTLVVASSENHSNLYELMVASIGDVLPNVDPGAPEKIRADMVFFETPGGGAVFSTGSIAWSGSLGNFGYDNNVNAVTGNVLRRFADPEPFTMPARAG